MSEYLLDLKDMNILVGRNYVQEHIIKQVCRKYINKILKKSAKKM